MENRVYDVTVTEVVDGDTFWGEVDLGFDVKLRRDFRVLGIDTPEIFHPKTEMERVKGIQARDKAVSLLQGKKVKLTTAKTDKYGRTLADVFLPDGTSYSKTMKELGFEKMNVNPVISKN